MWGGEKYNRLKYYQLQLDIRNLRVNWALECCMINMSAANNKHLNTQRGLLREAEDKLKTAEEQAQAQVENNHEA